MSEAAQLAKTARELLASALNALQTNAHVPDQLMEIAEPVAEAMSILHRIERTQGASLDGRDRALANVRASLDMLQRIDVHHPALDVVMEAVASSLGKVHALTRVSAQPVPAAAHSAPHQPPQHAPQQQAPQHFPPPQQQHAAHHQAPPAPAPAAAGFGYTQPLQAFPNAQAPGSPPYLQPAHAPQPVQQQQQRHVQPAPMVQQQPVHAHQPAPAQAAHVSPFGQYAAPVPQPPPTSPSAGMQAHLPPPRAAVATPAAAPSQGQAPAGSSQRPPAPAPVAGAQRVDVELGTHSTSNFYKGLGGNDVIEHGGIFVATYKIPKIGVPVTLRVLMPGDYEFQANGVVQWTREAGTGGDSAEPGFGARFTHITPEGRQLVYRYTRNREPLFYDDL